MLGSVSCVIREGMCAQLERKAEKDKRCSVRKDSVDSRRIKTPVVINMLGLLLVLF